MGAPGWFGPKKICQLVAQDGPARGHQGIIIADAARIFPAINDFSMVALPNCTIFRGDMGSRADLRRMARSVPTPFDIIVEDGSHASHHQQIALATLFPFVAAGGLYIIEDLHWQPAAIEKIAIPKTRSLCRDFRWSGTFRSSVITDGESAYLAEKIESIDLFDTMDRYNIDNKDGLAVITKQANVAGCQTAT
jgi:hypothetical protein